MAWFPTHNSIPRLIKNFIPFGNKKFNNTNLIINEEHIHNTFLKTHKLKIYPNYVQQTILNGWFLEVNSVYNYTNQFLKNKVCIPFPFMEKGIIKFSCKFIDDFKLVKKVLNFQFVRNEINDYINEIHNFSSTYRHTLDYAVKLCVEMYKSAFSNYKARHIKHFNIKNIKTDKRRFNLTLEPVNFNKQFNAFAYKELGLMESDRLFNTFNINHNVILQYDRLKKSYYLLIPLDKTINTVVYREEKCGIDIGCRTFMTIYSNNKCIEVGNNKIIKQIDKANNKLDKLKSHHDLDKMSKKVKSLLNIVSLASDPQGSMGDLFFNVTDRALKFHDGNGWVSLAKDLSFLPHTHDYDGNVHTVDVNELDFTNINENSIIEEQNPVIIGYDGGVPDSQLNIINNAVTMDGGTIGN